MPCQVLPNGFAGGCLPAYAVQGGIKPLTCTHFDPNIFLIFSKSIFFHISPTSPKKSIMGNSSTSLLKLHTGATQALTRARESWLACLKIIFVHYYCFSLFLVYGIKPILSSHRQSFLRFFKNKNFDLQLFFFRVNITHHEGDFFCFVSCVLQDVSISMKVSGVPLRNILCLTRSGQAIPLLHTWLLKRCVIPRKMLNS